MQNKDKATATHIMLFPLTWDIESGRGSAQAKGAETYRRPEQFDERTNLQEFNTRLLRTEKQRKGAGGHGIWKRKLYDISSPQDFNEISYFHRYAWKAIFDLPSRHESGPDKLVDPQKILVYYEYEGARDGLVRLRIKDAQEIVLAINRISLFVFTTGVMIVAYELENHDHTTPEEILLINEYLRRIYPNFMKTETGTNLIGDMQDKYLPQQVVFEFRDEQMPAFREDFSYYNDLSRIKVSQWVNGKFERKTLFHPPAFLRGLFDPDQFSFVHPAEGMSRIRLMKVTGDSMFFLCWYYNPKLVDELGNLPEASTDESDFPYVKDPFWYAFVFGCKSPQHLNLSNRAHQAVLVRDATYSRWATPNTHTNEHGTLYGITALSWVCLTGWKPSQDIVQRNYFKMSILTLAQQASILRFSEELSEVGDMAKINPEVIAETANALYPNYLEFINKFRMREVTADAYGKEMYDKLQETLGIHGAAYDLEVDLRALHEFLAGVENRQQTKVATRLTLVATILLPITVVTGLFGMNFANQWAYRGVFSSQGIVPFLEAIGIAGIISASFYFGLQFIARRSARGGRR